MNVRNFSAIALAAGSLWCGSAMAQISTWDLTDRTTDGACGSTAWSAFGNTVDCKTSPSGTTTTLQARAYSTTGAGGTYQTASVNDQGLSGLGARNQSEPSTSPDHAFDNIIPGGSDALLLDFEGTSRVLSSITLGWSNADSDFQVLRWTGASNATQATVEGKLLSKTAGALTGDGWELVSTVDGLGTGSTDQTFGLSTINSMSKSSSWWLITAYNSSIGGGLDAGDDAFKISGVKTTVPGMVSAPGTLALAGLGLFGVAVLRRRQA